MFRTQRHSWPWGALAVCAVLSSLAAGTVFGQSAASGVAGVISDNHGDKIPDAAVTLRNVENGTEEHAISDAAGNYEFPSVRTGSYMVTVRAQGFSTADSETFAVAGNLRQRVDVVLRVEGSTQTVEVNAEGTSLETDTSDRGQVFEQTEITRLPINGREYTDLALVAPGATSSQLEDDPIEPRRGSFHMNGMRSSVNNFELDGLDNNSYQNSNLGYNNQTITPSPDAIEQTRIITSNYPAEYGRSGGSIVSTVSRSGTDRLHISGWEYFRDSALAAYGPLYETGHKPQILQNQYGGTLGAPLLRDRLFFFLNDDTYRISNNAYYLFTLPNLQERQGQFYDQTGLPIPITNPYTGVVYADGVIPPSDMTPFAQATLSTLPQPTNSLEYDNYAGLARGQNTRDLGEMRLDSSMGPRIRAFGRYSQQINHILPASPIPGPAGGYGDGHIYSVTNQAALGATFVLTPAQLVDARLGVTRVASGRFPYNYGQGSYYTKFGIPYPIDPAVGTVSLNTQAVDDISSFGTETLSDIYQNPFTVDPRVHYSLAHLRHTMEFGYELLVLKTPTAWQSPVYGEDIYNEPFTRTTSAPATSTVGYQPYYVADFLYGARSEYELSNYSRLTQNMRFHSWFAEDTWKVASRMTLNYGLRYEFTVPDFESQNHLSNFDPTTNSLKVAHNGSYATRSLVNAQKDNLAPRLGLAYTVLPRMVWRTGYGISYIQFNRASDVALEYNGPYSIKTIIQQISPANNVCPAGTENFGCFRPTMQGYPASMNSAAAFTTGISESYYMPPSAHTGYVQEYYLGMQYQAGPHSIFDVAYAGSHGSHIMVIGDYNQSPLISSANEGTVDQRRPIKNFVDIWMGLPEGFLKFNSLEVKFEERLRRLYVVNSFTWSQARDNAGGDLETGNGDSPVVNMANIRGDAGISGYNQPLNDSTAAYWTLPRSGLRSSILRGALDGWRISAIDHIVSGLPLNIYYAPATGALTTNLPYHLRPNVAGDPRKVLNPKSQWQRLGGGQYIGNVFNASLVSSPASTVLYGNMPRNSIRFVPRWNLDAGVSKDLRIHNEGILTFQINAFNAPNKTNWNAPDVVSSTGYFGDIGSATASRQIQISVRYAR